MKLGTNSIIDEIMAEENGPEQQVVEGVRSSVASNNREEVKEGERCEGLERVRVIVQEAIDEQTQF